MTATDRKLRTELVHLFGEEHVRDLEIAAQEAGATFETMVVAHVAHGDAAHRFEGVVTADKIAGAFRMARYVDAMNAHVPDCDTRA